MKQSMQNTYQAVRHRESVTSVGYWVYAFYNYYDYKSVRVGVSVDVNDVRTEENFDLCTERQELISLFENP